MIANVLRESIFYLRGDNYVKERIENDEEPEEQTFT